MVTVSTPNERLKELRVQKRLSIRQAGDLAAVSHGTITNFENDPDYLDYTNARHRDAVKRLARAYGVTPQFIWDGVPGAVREESPEYETRPQIPATILRFLLDIATDPDQPQDKRKEAKDELTRALGI